MNFHEHQKQNTLNAAKVFKESDNQLLQLAGELLTTIANHPSLMESTYEFNEDIQNAVNDLSSAVLKQEF